MTEPRQLVFGPVPSRRLGRSLGLDLVPRKVCTLDCVYCQVGRTTRRTLQRESFVDINRLLAELDARLAAGAAPDTLTLSGSGEPTLNRDLGRIIAAIKARSALPITLITNGTLLYRDDVRSEAVGADRILPSLDAADDAHFERVNRPHPSLSAERHIEGLTALRRDFTGPIWLEIFLVHNVNVSEAHLDAVAAVLPRLAPDRIHLNTAVRPTADRDTRAAAGQTLQSWAARLGPRCEIIADFQASAGAERQEVTDATVIDMLERRPCTAADVASGLGLDEARTAAILDRLVKQGKLRPARKGVLCFYVVPDKSLP